MSFEHTGYQIISDEAGYSHIEVSLSDYALITSSLLNKGVGFTEQERDDFSLHGLVPPYVAPIEVQHQRAYRTFLSKKTPLEKYIDLRDLQDANETLFYNLVSEHLEEILPFIYTPTVGEGCLHFSHFYRRPRGVFISYPTRDRIEQILSLPRFDHTEVIVVSDGERILGMGDLGAGGMGIPIGKLSLYTSCAGIHPRTTLPILLDTGTNNSDLLKDPLYVGWHHSRIRGEEYAHFVDHFVQVVKKRFPHVLLHWEDFAQQNATALLDRYRNELCTFNDDIQGTAAVVLGTLLSAMRQLGSTLREQRIVIVGAGSAGCGIAHLLKQAMLLDGVSEEEAGRRFFLLDRPGLLLEGMDLLPFQKEFAQPKGAIQKLGPISLSDVVHHIHPTILIGVCGQGGIFTQEIVKEMAAHVKRPIIFPLSNPTELSEAIPEDLINWTQGRAIMGTGSPFPDVTKEGRRYKVDQTNNAYIFPGIGLGLIAVKAARVTDSMLVAAAFALAKSAESEINLLPPLSKIREVSFDIALAVAKEAVRLGLAEKMDPIEIEKRIRRKMWEPVYLPYKKRII